MPNTPILALPYPVATDTADVPRDIQALATKLDGYGTSLHPPQVTSLPGSPVDGQECYYLADATAGIIWHLRYRSASASAYKWECLAGAPLITEVDAQSGTATAAYTALGGPAVTVPLAGDYDVTNTARMILNAPSGQPFLLHSYAVGATAASDSDAVMLSFTAVAQVSGASLRRKTVPAAATVLQSMLKSGGTVTGSASFRRLAAAPVRVG